MKNRGTGLGLSYGAKTIQAEWVGEGMAFAHPEGIEPVGSSIRVGG